MIQCHAKNSTLRETNKASAVICWIMEDLLFPVKSMQRLDDTFIPSHIILIVLNMTIVQQCNIVMNNWYFVSQTKGKYLYICYLSCRRRPTCWCPWWLCSCVPGFRSISWMFWWTWAFWKLCSGTSAQHNSHNHLRQININIYENFVDNHMVQKHSSVYHLRPFNNNIKYVYIIYPQHS